MKISISNMGPIVHAELIVNKIVILTGMQASGKSTISKAVYFFRTIKDEIAKQTRQYWMQKSQGTAPEETLEIICLQSIRRKFLNTFGSSYSVDPKMKLECRYDDKDTMITISPDEGKIYGASNYVNIHFSHDIWSRMKEYGQLDAGNGLSDQNLDADLNTLFHDPYRIIYIPAGRSLIALLGEQYLLFYSTLDDAGKRMIDECTQNFIQLIPRLKPVFTNGLQGIENNNGSRRKVLEMAQQLSWEILHGGYQFRNGEERLVLKQNGQKDENVYVKMSYASSGQQSAVWIINLLYYYIASGQKICFIIEEPELNLFPESQKYMAELIALAAHENEQIFVTTHSPYILGEFNNILLASWNGYTPEQKVELDKIIPQELWSPYDEWTAAFVSGGTTTDLKDDQFHQMDGDQLDAISSAINEEYDRIVECAFGDPEGAMREINDEGNQ